MSVNDLQHLEPPDDEISRHHPRIDEAFRQMLFNIRHNILIGAPLPADTPKLRTYHTPQTPAHGQRSSAAQRSSASVRRKHTAQRLDPML